MSTSSESDDSKSKELGPVLGELDWINAGSMHLPGSIVTQQLSMLGQKEGRQKVQEGELSDFVWLTSCETVG